MARLLCVTAAMPGMLFPAVELARRLVRRGHELTLLSDERARSTVTGAGIDFGPLDSRGHSEFLEEDAKKGWAARLRDLPARRARAASAFGSLHFESTLRQIDPDLLLIDGELHAEIITAITAEVPLALLNSFVAVWRHPEVPPPHCSVRPGVGLSGSRFGIWALWKRLRLRKWARARRLALRHLGCDHLSALRQLARDRGLDLRETDASQWLIPFTYRSLPVLSLHALEFEFPHRPPDGVHYVGPLLLEARGEAVGRTVHAELEAIYASCRDTGRTLIYAGFGSFLSTELSFLRRLVQGVASRQDWTLVLSLGGRLSPGALGDLPERVHAFRWLPQPDVLRRATVAVTHGAINTTDECVLSGVPSLAYCGGETDMAGSTARLVHHGLGLAGDSRDSPGMIESRIDRLLREPEFRDNVYRFRGHYEAYAANQVAERAVESILDSIDKGPVP